jgi:hypothetical protein
MSDFRPFTALEAAGGGYRESMTKVSNSDISAIKNGFQAAAGR